MRYVILGNGAAGVSAAEAIRDYDKDGAITIVSDEPGVAYSRPLTSYYVAGKVDESRMTYRDEGFYESMGVERRSGVTAESLDVDGHIVGLSDGTELPYDRLLLATGARAVMEDVPGNTLPGVHVLRTLKDAQDISARVESAEHAVMIGGGLVSMKAADALARRGLKITVLVSSGRILSQILDPGGAEVVRAYVEDRGWDIRTGVSVKEFRGDDEGVRAVVTDAGDELPADVVIVGKGVRPNVDLAVAAGIDVDRGILVDDGAATSQLDVFAAGDVAQGFDVARQCKCVTAVWPNAIYQGRVAGHRMAGGSETYRGSTTMNSIEFYGLPVVAAGITNPRDDKYEEMSVEDPDRRSYRKAVLEGDVLRGFVMVNNIDRAGVLTGLILTEADVSGFKNDLLDPEFGFIYLPEEHREAAAASGA